MVFATTQAASGAVPASTYTFSGQLVDLNINAASPFDGAQAMIKIVEAPNGTSSYYIQVKGIDPSVTGVEFGSHLHLGVCQENNPDATLGHYNTDKLAGVDPPEISAKTEVWLDLVPDDDGVAVDQTLVPFVADKGPLNERSIVIHQHETYGDGTAGPKVACLPLKFSDPA
jgi:Cu/Zn superoxide dismutase